MRVAFSLLSIIFVFTATAQVKIPRSIGNSLKSDRTFTSYAREMMRYVKNQQSQYPDSSREGKYYSKQEKYLARSLWYLEGRQNADGTIGNYSKKTFDAIQQYKMQQPIEQNASATGAWSFVGPNNNTPLFSNTSGIGRADRIAFHPTNSNILFAGTPSSGIFKSINGGDSWSNLNAFIPSLGISGLVVSWANPDVIYALTGDGDSNIGDNGFVQGFDYIRPSIGVLKSTDGGTSWQQTGTLYNTDSFFVGYKLLQSPFNANVLIAATSRGLYRTTNGGNSWSRVSSAENRFFDIEWKPGSTNSVYAASADTFYISEDGAASFVNQNNNITNLWDSCSRISLSVSPANPNIIYLLAGFTGYNGFISNKGLYKSSNSGSSFSRFSTSFFLVDGLPEYMLNLATAPNNSTIVLTGALDIFRSTNSGVNFSTSNTSFNASNANYVHADIHDLAFNPLDNTLYVASDGGVYKSADNGITYDAKYVGFTASQFYHFDVSTLDDDYMYAGAQDNGIMYRPGNTVSFQKVVGGDGYDVKFENGSTTKTWASINTSLYKSNAGFTDFDQETAVGGGWFKRIVMSYINTSHVYVSAGTIYRTLNDGASWTDIGANGRWAMATCPSNANRLYAAGGHSWNALEDDDGIPDKHFYRSDNQGNSWIALENNPGMPDSITKFTCIEVSPTNSSQVWITMGGFIDGQKVYYSNDAGNNWTNLTGSIPNMPVNCIVIDANNDAYIGTDAGVFYRSASMNNWQPFYNLLPQIPITELHIRNGRIYASTFGRGIWTSETKGPCSAAINFTSPVSGIKYYEALNFTSNTSLKGGASAQLFLKAQQNIILNPGFLADASTGEKFRAWIGNCGTGGIPQMTAGEPEIWMSANKNKNIFLDTSIDSTQISIDMPFDGKASLLILNEHAQVKEVLLFDKVMLAGKTTIHITEKIDWSNQHLVLVIDGQVMGVIKQNR